MKKSQTFTDKKTSADEIAIKLTDVSKYYKLYKDPKDRLKEVLSLTGKKYHKEFYATNDINLEIKKGEIVGILGKNGSGKSTLLKLISKVLVPSKGVITVNGDISALLELGTGFNPQFTGLENIYFYGSVMGLSRKEIDKIVDDIIEFADIGEFINQPIKIYSSGMKARLGFSVATHIDPDILILDEVLSVGDVLFKRKSYSKMQTFFESGKTIIYVSHNTNEINRLCTRAIFLLDGSVVMDGEPKQVTQYYEKYLFAKKENHREILEEIKQYSSTGDVHRGPEKNRGNKKITMKEIKTNDPSKALYIPNFISSNRLEYDNTYLDIYDICIKTMRGKVVNNLAMHERYRYCYKMKFKKKFFNVGFGMQIHSEKGIAISGCGARRCESDKILSHVEEGEVVEVEWEFTCLMRQGVYYTNNGCDHMVNGEKKLINRITDALAFKVMPSNDCCGGLFSLEQSPPKITRFCP